LKVIGQVRSTLVNTDQAPRQPDEGAPSAWLEFAPDMRAGLTGVRPGDMVIVLTWLHLARRDVLRVHPRGDAGREEAGVFSTRSPDRPNPIGLHHAEVVAVEGLRVQVRHLEAVHGTPILDLKPVLEVEVGCR